MTMLTSTFLSFILLITHFSSPANGQPVLHQSCGSTGNYTTNSTYESNLNSILTTLTNNTPTSGFSNATVGQIPDQVYGLAMCRGDVNATTCRTCLQTAQWDALQLCPYDKAATIYYDECLLSYSNLFFLSSFDNSEAQVDMFNTQNVSDAARFDRLVHQILNGTADYAAYNTTKRFATGLIANFTKDNPNIYGLVQCTPDMSGGQCWQCLQGTFGVISTSQLSGKQGGRVLGVRCNFRYELYQFFEGDPMIKLNADTSPPSFVQSTGKKHSKAVVVVIAIAITITSILTTIICLCIWRATYLRNKLISETDLNECSSSESSLLILDSSIIQLATNNFDNENKLGEGGFGAVYKGVLPDGREVAVKKLLQNSDRGLKQLKNEFELLAKLQHRNLVKLLGVCWQEEKVILYEYFPNQSLDKFLFDPIRCRQLQWETRYKIIYGVARALLYLHEESQLKIVHRDLKTSNILLDEDMNPKISDFGIARLFGIDLTQGNTSQIVGTNGYMAPEYAMRGKFSTKSDVFSFGILILEIITGRTNSETLDSEDLLSYTWNKWRNGTILDIFDRDLGDYFPRSDVLRCIQIALLCVQENPLDRPKMSAITVMLSSDTISICSPLRPPFIFEGTTNNFS